MAIPDPTNTGKTYPAIERMLAHESGITGLLLRLLAREVCNRIAEKAGTEHVSLITGKEKIMPLGAGYLVCTVEAIPGKQETLLLGAATMHPFIKKATQHLPYHPPPSVTA